MRAHNLIYSNLLANNMDEDEGRLPNIIGLLSRIKDELERIADVLEYQAGKL